MTVADSERPRPIGSGRALLLVAEREIRQALGKRSVRLVMLGLFLAATALVVIPEIIGDDGPDRFDIGVVGEDPGLAAELPGIAALFDVEVTPVPLTGDAAARQAVADGDVDAAIVPGEDLVYIDADPDEPLPTLLRQAVGTAALTRRLEDAGLDDDEVDAVLEAPAVELVPLGDNHDERRGIGFAISFVLYVAFVLMGSQIGTGVAVEKATRISEVLIATVKPAALLFGKVLGVVCVNILGLLALLTPIFARLVVKGDLPDGSLEGVLLGLAWFGLGAALYAVSYGVLGSLVERQEEAGTTVMPLTAVLIASFTVVSVSVDSPLAVGLSLFPFTAPIVMPARAAAGEASATEVVLAVVLTVVTIVVVVRMGAVLYRRAIVRTGRRLKLRDLLRRAGD